MSDKESTDETINSKAGTSQSDDDGTWAIRSLYKTLKPVYEMKKQFSDMVDMTSKFKCTVPKGSVTASLNTSLFSGQTEKFHSIKTISQSIKEKETSNVVTNNADNCIECNQPIKNHTFYSLRKYDEGATDCESKGLKECLNFCSGTCLHDYQEQIDNAEEYHLYEVTRCASYYDCLKINNLRQMCTKENRLDYEPASFGYLPNMSMINFCKPADAGIIKASLNIHKQLEESSKQIEESSIQNSRHFNITAIMTVLVIVLTILNTYVAYSDTYEPLLNGINEKLESINNNILSLGNIVEADESSLITGVNLTNYSIPNNDTNISKFNI